ncbi:MAG: glycerophosphodiester phosphodiesterase [Myxococcota bacterium]
MGFLDRLPRPANIAHRGGAGLYPENTLVAFEAEVRLHRAHALELDVHLSRDGVLVVTHDATVERCTDGEGPVVCFSYAELSKLDAGHRFTIDRGATFPFRGKGVRIPRLDEVLDALPEVPLNIEVKPEYPEAAEELARVLRKTHAVERVLVGSELDGVAAHVAELLPEACRFFPHDSVAAFIAGMHSGSSFADPRYHVFELPHFHEGKRLVDVQLVQAAHRLGCPVFVWTVNEPKKMRELLSIGVDGLITDRPDLLAAELSPR